MRRLFSLFLAAALLSSCITVRVWSPQELGDWYLNQLSQMAGNAWSVRLGYLGSDAQFHYFITRPVDEFIMPRIPRSELTLPDVRPYRQGIDYYYLVDPSQGYRKVP